MQTPSPQFYGYYLLLPEPFFKKTGYYSKPNG